MNADLRAGYDALRSRDNRAPYDGAILALTLSEFRRLYQLFRVDVRALSSLPQSLFHSEDRGDSILYINGTSLHFGHSPAHLEYSRQLSSPLRTQLYP